ncbi:MAG: hypothetical protein ACOCSR_01840 [Wenzhouxiangella sp.]
MPNSTRPGAATQLATGGLTVGTGPHPGHATLMRFDFSGQSPDAAATGLRTLGGELQGEFWQCGESVESGADGSLRWRRAPTLMALSFEDADDGNGDLARAAFDGYRKILGVMAESGFDNLLRAWNYMPDINHGSGDTERYRQFCLGRGRALENAGISEDSLCAGTAIGTHAPGLRIHVLAGRTPGVNIENPRQVSAYRYPRRYGPRSPSFARATALPRADGSALLMISGTASVVGHETAHPGDLDAQLDEIVVNIDALLDQSVRQLGNPGLGRFGPASLVRAYVRHASDWPRVAARLAAAWPDAHIVGLHGDICRSDLMVEIEAVSEA